MNPIVEAVAEQRRNWVAVVNDRDLEGYTDLVTDDVVWLTPSGEAVVGRDAFRSWLEPFFETYAYHFSLEPREVRTFEGWCAELGRFRSVLTEEGGGEPREHGGRYLVLWRLEDDGVWRIERYVDGVGGGSGDRG